MLPAGQLAMTPPRVDRLHHADRQRDRTGAVPRLLGRRPARRRRLARPAARRAVATAITDTCAAAVAPRPPRRARLVVIGSASATSSPAGADDTSHGCRAIRPSRRRSKVARQRCDARRMGEPRVWLGGGRRANHSGGTTRMRFASLRTNHRRLCGDVSLTGGSAGGRRAVSAADGRAQVPRPLARGATAVRETERRVPPPGGRRRSSQLPGRRPVAPGRRPT